MGDPAIHGYGKRVGRYTYNQPNPHHRMAGQGKARQVVSCVFLDMSSISGMETYAHGTRRALTYGTAQLATQTDLALRCVERAWMHGGT